MSRAVPPSVILGGRWACESERTTHAHTLSQQLDDVTTHLAAAVHTELSTMSTSLTYMHLSRRFPELASCQLASQASRPVCLCVCVCCRCRLCNGASYSLFTAHNKASGMQQTRLQRLSCWDCVSQLMLYWSKVNQRIISAPASSAYFCPALADFDASCRRSMRWLSRPTENAARRLAGLQAVWSHLPLLF